MPSAVDLLREDRNEELWQMCCGYLGLSLRGFMAIQERLLMEQIDLLARSPLGNKILRGARPGSVAEFRRQVPLTRYADYCPDLLEKREDGLPVKPELWARTSGRSGEYPCRWIPITPQFADELSVVLYGLGILAGCREAGDTYNIPERPRLVYTVAPRPYITGAMTCMLERQTPIKHMPGVEEAEKLSFEERVKLGFKEALSQGIDYFFGLSMVLVAVGDKFSHSSEKMDLRPLLAHPRALLRLAGGIARSKLARRPLLPRDLWSVKGIISSGLDSTVYRDKIKDLWGRYPLDVYASTEGGIIATQAWDYDGMTFIPSLNFLEFIPEEEHLKWQMDKSYQPRTLLLDEVRAGETYELVITNFHGGALVRYRIGDMVRITSLRNERLGIELPQMVFERRADDLINFVVIQLTEKIIWQAIERTGIAYEDWVAYRLPGESVLRVLIETKDGFAGSETDVAAAIQEQILRGADGKGDSGALEDLMDTYDFRVEALLLRPGTFAGYIARKQAEGADLAHIKPPHINPSAEVMATLLAGPEEEVIVVEKARVQAPAAAPAEAEEARNR